MEEEETFEVEVVAVIGKKIPLTINPRKTTFGDVKKLVFEAAAIPVDEQRLIYNGKQLHFKNNKIK